MENFKTQHDKEHESYHHDMPVVIAGETEDDEFERYEKNRLLAQNILWKVDELGCFGVPPI